MYRRLKNLLGVSLIILAIVLSQLPMGAVQADTTVQSGTEEQQSDVVDTTENTGGDEVVDADGTNDKNDNENQIDEKVAQENLQKQDQNIDVVSGDENTDDTNKDANTDDINTDVTNESDPDPAADTRETFEVTFDYGFLGLNPTIQKISVKKGDPIQIEASEWKITDKNGQQVLEKHTPYEIGDAEGTEKYEFVRWYTQDKDSKDSVTETWDMTKNTVKENITLYAEWSCKNTERIFKITFSADDATSSNTLQDMEIKAGTRLVPPKSQPTKIGSTFDKWVSKSGQDDVPINYDMIPTSNMTFYARWIDREYVVTYNANGGTFRDGSPTVTEIVPSGQKLTSAPDISQATHSSCTADTTTWYRDKECLNVFDKDSSTISKSMMLYVKWTKDVDGGFKVNGDGTVLYEYTGKNAEVVIPSTVRTIAARAFKDLSMVESITIPAEVADIREDAFIGAVGHPKKIDIYSTTTTIANSKLVSQALANKYDCFEYKASINAGGGSSVPTDTAQLAGVTCSLSEINRGMDDNSNFIYPKVFLPLGLQSGYYKLNFSELNNPGTLKNLLAKAGHDVSEGKVFYMDITLQKTDSNNEYITTWPSGTMSISMPLPISWYGRDKQKIYMYTVNSVGTALEEVAITDITNNIFTFQPQHFSEYALVFSGNISSGSGSADGSVGGSGSSGGSTGGSTGGSGSSGGSTGGSGSSGGSAGESGSSGGSAGGSGSSAGNSGGSGTSGNNATLAPGVTTPNIPLVTPAPAPGTQPVITTPTGTGGSSAGGTTAHVKDSTPKTGDPLEYRSLLVCTFFSIGMLLLLIGNKKKTSSSSRYLRV